MDFFKIKEFHLAIRASGRCLCQSPASAEQTSDPPAQLHFAVGGFSVISDDTVSTTFTELVFHASSGIQSSFVSPLPASAQSVTNRRVLLAAGGAITAAVLPPVVAAEASGVTGSCFPCMSAAGGTPSLEINGPYLHHVLER